MIKLFTKLWNLLPHRTHPTKGTTPVSRNLRKVLELFGPEGEHWSQEYGLISPDKTQFCLLGGINLVTTGRPSGPVGVGAYAGSDETRALVPFLPAYEHLAAIFSLEAILDGSNSATGVVVFNDANETTWPEVERVVLNAIAAEERHV